MCLKEVHLSGAWQRIPFLQVGVFEGLFLSIEVMTDESLSGKLRSVVLQVVW